MLERPSLSRQAERVRLEDLLASMGDEPTFSGAVTMGVGSDDLASVELLRAVHDSRVVRPGDLFCCIPGGLHDGHDHADEAVAAGAAALLVERRTDAGVAEIQVASVRRAMGPVASKLAGEPSRTLDVVGITGTNGKTTTAHLLASILDVAGRNCGVIGTLSGVRTTPEAPELQELLGAFLAEGRRSVAMEVSSHALDLHRVDGTHFRVGVFTNLGRDHLDYHGDIAAYFQAKAALFEPHRCEKAVLNIDDPHGRLLRDAALIPSVGFSLADAENLSLTRERSTFRWHGIELEVGIPGKFNVSNALAAALTAEELGVRPDHIAEGLARVRAVPGRFEEVRLDQPFFAAVDFAHTPDGLENLLTAAREFAQGGRVLVVFGAGGNRDRSKRPEMGEVVARLADLIFLTTDNPRHEDPAAIMSSVEQGMNQPEELIVEPDRRRAINLAVQAARPGDVLLVAGKGHELTQTVGDVVLPFDDREVLAEALRLRSEGSGW